MFAIHGRAASSSLSLLILTGLFSLNSAKPITISSDSYFLHRIKLDKILLCPTDMVETARNATNWPVDSVTIPDDSRCMTYNDTFKYPVGTIMAGDHRDCLGELINGATLTMRKLGVDPFMTGMSLAKLPPWVNFAEAGMDRSQCESAFAEMHTKNSIGAPAGI
ncbi:hypothetical protein Pmar_PMAR011579 [Perkinsus marinus ATCC 50983]|uniref:Uncharacterized protein n=1 Tax=Perkinsus marinus (strain ATCC 50983 / TXsc) TaxID=423536 RepID=C5LC68_PERM5|nr:hypothetical protein Pmar_PMAR011579 [Perkinsus marinus ATCC 50983]EER05551.1 hypothetical protein Pmar_PMAR011579 [Perkinsus marinus ATCC 50983]|eukprot:XP_002773735.1 hypothetical protein Pmar_PMAR011579 [Perkinsus marinus ATCC 50983]